MTDRVDHSDSPDDAADGEITVSGKRRPLVFVLLTCGFLACMCCVGGVFTGGVVGYQRMQNLGDALETIGAPQGWTSGDESTSPWSASAELSGPRDAEAFTDWLYSFDPDYMQDTAETCLAPYADPCETPLSVDGFDVVIGYQATSREGSATVTVD